MAGITRGPVGGHLGYLCGQISYQLNSEFGFYCLMLILQLFLCTLSNVITVVESHIRDTATLVT